MSKYFGVYIKLAAIKKQISVDRHEIVVHKKKGSFVYCRFMYYIASFMNHKKTTFIEYFFFKRIVSLKKCYF